MKKYIKNLSITGLIVFAVIFGISANYYKIFYIKDYIYGFFINIADKIIPGQDRFTTIKPGLFRNYIKPYSNLPDNFFQSGHFLFFKPLKNMKIDKAALEAVKYTDFIHASDLSEAIKKYNSINSDMIEKNNVILIPKSIPSLIIDIKKINKPDIIYSRGLYFSGNSIGSNNILERIKEYKEYGINTVVFDVKDINGIINYYSSVDEVKRFNTHEKRTIDNISKFIRELKKIKMHTVARIAVFHDQLLAKKYPQLSIRSKRTGKRWNPYSKEIWCDPTNRAVQDYNIKIAIELSEAGIDEIQFDYIRFPTTGHPSDALYAFDFGKMSKDKSIALFLKRAYKNLSSRNTLVSVDIFGVVAWGKKSDIKKTGQSIELLSKYCDIISPMLYPSHFNNEFGGFSNPGDHPYHFIHYGSKKLINRSNKNIVVRPWLQAFKWRVTRFDERYILEQIRAVDDSGAFGYLFWNSSNKYGTVLKALQKISISKN